MTVLEVTNKNQTAPQLAVAKASTLKTAPPPAFVLLTRLCQSWLFWIAVITIGVETAETRGEAPLGTKRIEQDWRVQLYSVSDPSELTAPLFVAGFAIPNTAILFLITWNHRDQPDMEEGGIQMQLWRRESLLTIEQVVTPPWREKLSSNSEVVTWTQEIRIEGRDHVFSVKNIVGTTWGTIPGPYTLRRSYLLLAPPLELYSYQEIAKESGITMGTNRFARLAILQTRFYDAAGQLLAQDTEEKVLFSQPPEYEYFEFQQLNE